MPGMSTGTQSSGFVVTLFYIALITALVVFANLLLVARPWVRRNLTGTSPQNDNVSRLRNTLAYWLGALWLFDGLLQMQPQMVTRFIGGVLAPLLTGQPTAVRMVIETGIRLWSLSPLWFNVAAVLVQIAIGVSLLFSQDGSPIRRYALWVSIGWGLVVWTGGEAFGSLFAGGGPLVGSPGSAILYVVAAVLLLLPPSRWIRPSFWRYIADGTAGFFMLMAFLAAWPPNGWWTRSGASWMATMASMPQPGVLARPLLLAAHSYGAHPVAWNGAITATTLLLACGWFFRPGRLVLGVSVIWALFMWYVGQDFGVLGGMGTDPNTGGILLVYLLIWRRHLRSGRPDAVAADAPPEPLRHLP